MLGEKELDIYMKSEESETVEKKEVDVKAVFDIMNENLAKLIEAMGDLSTVLTKDDGEKVEEEKVEEVKETETEEEKEV